MSKINESIFSWLLTLTQRQFLWLCAIVYISGTMLLYSIGLHIFNLRPASHIHSIVFGFVLLNSYPLAKGFWRIRLRKEAEDYLNRKSMNQ